MIFPLLPNFLLTVLLGNRFYLGVIEGAADSAASFLKLWSGGRSDQAGRRKRVRCLRLFPGSWWRSGGERRWRLSP